MNLGHIILRVSSQEEALLFYTSVIGLRKCEDLRIGDFRWLTLMDRSGAVKLVLEIASPGPASQAQATLHETKLPALVLTSEDIEADVSRLTANAVQLLGEIADFPGGRTVFFDDGLGNIINLTQPAR
jgi:predicted enzyme related to lactoylglutathione lyase